MATRERIIAAVAACALHLALLVPSIGEQGGVLYTDFGPEAIAIEQGTRPYGDEELEYPPLSIPVIAGPALVTEGLDAYNDVFQAQMLIVDLAIVLMLALALRGGRARVIGALAAYTLGVLAISGIVLGGSDIDEAPLALSRFDLVPAALVLAAVLARERGRSAAWGVLLSAGAAVKAYPLALFPALLRGEREPGRVAVGAAIPLVAAAALVLWLGDEFGAAISYHTGRGLQIESVAATPLEIAAINEVGSGAEYGSGSFNFVADGAGAARAVSIGLLVTGYALVLWAGWRARTPPLEWATALLAVIVVFSPVLSPQFLFWLLPISAAAYGFRLPNVLLVAACVLTQLMLQFYARVVVDFDPEFVWRLAGRNAVLLAYVVAVCAPIVAAARRAAGATRAGRGAPGAPALRSLERVDSEFDLIAALRDRLPPPGPGVVVGSGDDAAVTEASGRTATTVDAIVEGVHFTLPGFPPRAVGRKALAAALSDLAAMGAVPGQAYVVLGIPEGTPDDLLLELADGLAEVAGREGVSVVGGDVTRSPALTLAVTCVGTEPPGGRLVTRSGAQVGDVVVVTGELGGAAAAVGLLSPGADGAASEAPDDAELDDEVRGALLARQLDPRPRIEAGVALARAGATAMIDVSDGIGADARHLALAGGVRVEIEAHKLPVAPGVRELAGSEERALATAISGGEDFELLAALPPGRVEAAREAVGDYGLTQIGRVLEGMEGRDVSVLALDGRELEPGGFDHMRGSRSG